MKRHAPEEFFTRLMDWGPFVIMGNRCRPEILMKTKRTRTTPTNRRSCASRTKTRIPCSWQSAYSISHELGCERRSAAQESLGRRTVDTLRHATRRKHCNAPLPR
jgi:hypothetical protein